MTEQARVLVFEFFLSVSVAWFVYSYLYKRVRLDAFREALFTVRDDLFDYMWRSGLSYEEPAYRLLRSSLNGMIRSAEDGSFNLVTVSACMRAMKEPRVTDRPERVAAAIAAVQDAEARKHFEQVYRRVGMMGLQHIVLEGPLSLVLGPILIVWNVWRLHAPKPRPTVRSSWQQGEQEVVEVGIELDPSRGEKPQLIPAA